MNLKKMMMASALLMAACCMQAQTKVIAPWFLENSGIIAEQYFITSKSRFHRLLRFRI